MKTHLKVLALFLASLLFGCMGVKSQSEIDTKMDFTALKTYSWMPGVHEKFYHQKYAEYFMEAMDSQLASKGYKLDVENPDFSIRTQHTKEQKEKIKTFSSGELEFHKGTISMEFVDAKSGKVIYESEAETYLSNESKQDGVKKDVYKEVESLLKDLPPGGQNW